ncbi:MAG: hypothetical protein F6K26_03800 [Moorea sp. SIO2I5]|nr:hypothetical protein [Moorena sp. SIO2I5]
MGRKQNPQPTVTSKSKRANHFTGTMGRRSDTPVKTSGKGGEEYKGTGRLFGDIVPTSCGFREAVRTTTENNGHNALAPERQSKSEAKVKSIGFFGRRVNK